MHKHFPRTQISLVFRAVIVFAVLVGTAGCSSSLSSMLEPDRIDYKSASKAPTKTLDVPPNLTQLQRDNRYALPDNGRGTATASGYNLQQGTRPVTAATTVAPSAIADMRIERAGDQRWLVVKQTPEALWPQLKDFWQDVGFVINVEMPEAGVMETDWAENRLKVPQGSIRSTLGKVLDSIYDTGERDKFRTRLERGPDGSTEVYVSHRGAQEVITSVAARHESTVWTSRPSDASLEAQMLARLMTRLGAEEVKARVAVANAPAAQPKAKLVKGADGAFVEADEGFDRAWRRVGLALDRVGFTVEDRDRAQGLYFVRYIDQDKDAMNNPAAEKSFLSRLFSFGSDDDKAKSAKRYRVAVKEAGAVSRITILNGEGRPEVSETADKILGLLNEQLK